MSSQKTEAVTNRIFTIPNVISFIRLCMVPVYMVLLLNGYDLLATFMFALAAGTDWIDGQLARRTNCVSKLGQLPRPCGGQDPMSCGVIGLMLVGRLPIWIVFVVLGRDLMLLVGGSVSAEALSRASPSSIPARWPPRFCSSGSRACC